MWSTKGCRSPRNSHTRCVRAHTAPPKVPPQEMWSTMTKKLMKFCPWPVSETKQPMYMKPLVSKNVCLRSNPTSEGEHYQGKGLQRFLWSRTKVRGSKTNKYCRSPNHKICQLEIGGPYLHDSFSTFLRNQSLLVRSLRLHLIQQLTKSRHSKEWQFDNSFLISWVVVRGRFSLVGWFVWLIPLSNETWTC